MWHYIINAWLYSWSFKDHSSRYKTWLKRWTVNIWHPILLGLLSFIHWFSSEDYTQCTYIRSESLEQVLAMSSSIWHKIITAAKCLVLAIFTLSKSMRISRSIIYHRKTSGCNFGGLLPICLWLSRDTSYACSPRIGAAPESGIQRHPVYRCPTWEDHSLLDYVQISISRNIRKVYHDVYFLTFCVHITQCWICLTDESDKVIQLLHRFHIYERTGET